MAVDLNDPAFLADPYPTYARLREEEPVSWLPGGGEGQGMWLVTRYEAADMVMSDPLFRMDARGVREPDPALPPMPSLLDLDPPDHTRLRSLADQAFTPRLVADLAGRIADVTEGLLDEAEGTVDLIDAIASPLPAIVLAEMLGVPVDDRDRFRAWSADLFASVDAASLTEEDHERSVSAGFELAGYFASLVEERRDAGGDDLISRLIGAGNDQDRLDDGELISMLLLLVVTGHEPAAGLIGNGVNALLDHPDQMGLLRDEPGLAESAVEEMLRFDTPGQRSTFRFAGESTEIEGVPIEYGQEVSALIGAANRDPRRFTDPDTFDIRRDPNPHLGFGRGSHYCLGAPLARLEAATAITSLLERFGSVERAGPVEWRPSTFLRRPERLPVTTKVDQAN